MKNFKSVFWVIILLTFFQGCTRYVTVPGGMSSITKYYFSAGFENKLIESRNDSISEIMYFSEQGFMNSYQYTYVCEFCDKFFESQLILKNSNKKDYSYTLICSDFENNNRKTVQIEPGNYEVFMNLNCSGERDTQTRKLDMGKFEIKNGERRNLNIWIDLDIDEDDVILSPIKIPRKEYRKQQKENREGN